MSGVDRPTEGEIDVHTNAKNDGVYDAIMTDSNKIDDKSDITDNSSRKCNSQRHLDLEILLSTRKTELKENEDDNRCSIEKNVEWTSNNDDAEKDNKVKSSVNKIEGQNKCKTVKRCKIRISPKSKASPLYRLSKVKRSKLRKKSSFEKDDYSDDLDKLDDDD